VDRESAARALPAAVCSLPPRLTRAAVTRAFAAFAAALFPVARAGFAATASTSPPSAAFTFSISRLFRRAAAFRWMAPLFAARSSAEIASITADRAASWSPPTVAVVTALLTRVFAADRRG
jgi:hypothetical protein